MGNLTNSARRGIGLSLSHVARLLTFLAVAGPLVACIPFGTRPECPAKGGDPWIEVDAPHFHVVTDLGDEEAVRVAEQLEEGLEAIGQAAFVHARAPFEPTTVVVFRSESDFQAFAPDLAQGAFTSRLPNDLEPSPTILLYGGLTTLARISCLHELTHDLFARNFGGAPPWLNEGWALYYSTIRVEAGFIHAGDPLPGFIPTGMVPPPSQLLALDYDGYRAFTSASSDDADVGERAMLFYLGAWAFVHMLLDGPEPYPARFQRFIRDAVGDTPLDAAWARAFAGLAPAQIDRDFARYLAGGQVAVHRLPFARPAAQRVTRPKLSDPEVHVLWARLSRWKGASAPMVARDLEEAVARAPNWAEARYVRGLFHEKQGHVAKAEADLTAAVRLAPADPRFLLGVATFRMRQAEKEPGKPSQPAVTEAMEALSRKARSGTQLTTVARYLASSEPARALDFARRAERVAPVDPVVLDSYASLLAIAGRFAAAADAQRRAVSFLPDGANAPDFFERLKGYEEKAREGSPGR